MTEQQTIIMRCGYCQKETKLLVKTVSTTATQSQPSSVVRYCVHCNRPNKLELPDNLDVHVFILGQDHGFLGYQGKQHLPILQGEPEP
jgi:hypothetical protein